MVRLAKSSEITLSNEWDSWISGRDLADELHCQILESIYGRAPLSSEELLQNIESLINLQRKRYIGADIARPFFRFLATEYVESILERMIGNVMLVEPERAKGMGINACSKLTREVVKPL